MSENDHCPIISPTRKRRRVLTDIKNIEEPIYPEKTQRNSLAFDLVRIPATFKEPEVEKNMPKDTTSSFASYSRPNSLADMNTKGSGIPTLKKTDRFERFLTINESLNRKSTVYGLGADMKGSEYEWAEPKIPSSKAVVERLTQELKVLDHKLVEAREKSRYKFKEKFEVQQLTRALHNEHQLLKRAVEEQESKFEFLLGQVTTRVELMERDIQLQLKEYENKAQSSYNDVRFEVKAELERALHSEDTETAAVLAELEAEKQDLELKLKEIDLENERELEEVQSQYKKEFDLATQEIESRVSEAENELQELLREDAAIEQENEDLEREISDQQLLDQQKREAISELESTLQQYNSLQTELEAKVTLQTERLRVCEAEEYELRQKEAVAKAEYETEKKKYDLYICTRRRLEHAISKAGGKHRVFVRVRNFPLALDINREYAFGRVCALIPDPEYSRNWEILVQESLCGASTTLLFVGQPQHEMKRHILDVFEFLQLGLESRQQNGWSHNFYYQSVFISENHALCDQLNPSSEVSITGRHVTSQKMLVNNTTEISRTLHNNINDAENTPGADIHVFTVESTNLDDHSRVRGLVMVLDITRLPFEVQGEILSPECGYGPMSELIQQVGNDHTSLDVCDIDDLDTPGTQQVLTSLENRAG